MIQEINEKKGYKIVEMNKSTKTLTNGDKNDKNSKMGQMHENVEN